MSRRARLPQRNSQPGQIGIEHQSDLSALQMQDGALSVGQYDGACSRHDRYARTGGAIDPGDVRWMVDMGHGPRQRRPRSSEYEAPAEAANGQGVMPAMEAEGAPADGGAEDPASLELRNPDGAAVGEGRARNARADHGDQGDEACTKSVGKSHGGVLQEALSGGTDRQV